MWAHCIRPFAVREYRKINPEIYSRYIEARAGEFVEYETEVVFHNLDPSEFLERIIREKAAKLTRFFADIIHCRVTIEAPHHHQHQGRLYRAGITLKVPGQHIVVSKSSSNNPQHEDAYVAIRDAFESAKHQLRRYHQKIKRSLKHHESMPHGYIAKTFPQQGFGFIESNDGREIYFDQNSVVNGDFGKLEPGHQVRYTVEVGEDGPQASTLHVINRRRKKVANSIPISMQSAAAPTMAP